ncbi:MAG TPA: ADP/ATP-dependent (S)-NAD(P)H-hydrate dehydratase [Pseudolysinimonas sp.]|jgi:hydroxyethylthiazole kinase-like uncharacterized protein yjeF|nr:ADP/ATP-dependent (S)-NAD(P)H-hydrate dehydratase [Pseudolysinimonas sp.]
MSSDTPATIVTPQLLREWGLPDGGDSKYSRGQVLVAGGAARSPGATMLAGAGALRVGAGRLTVAVAESVAAHVAVALPESGVIPLPESHSGGLDGRAAGRMLAPEISNADAALIGPGLDDIDETVALLDALFEDFESQQDDPVMVLDAFALGALARRPELRDRMPARLVLTPNPGEAAALLGRDPDDLGADTVEIARAFRASVACQGFIADPGGALWQIGTGASGLGTSGSGDVLAGAAAGFCARGVPPDRAAVWASYAHAVAGDRLAVQVGPLGYLAGELLFELPRVLVEIGAGTR